MFFFPLSFPLNFNSLSEKLLIPISFLTCLCRIHLISLTFSAESLISRGLCSESNPVPSCLPTLVCASELQKRRRSVNSIIPMEIGGNCRLPQTLCRLLGICERTLHVPRMFAVPFQQPCPLHSTVPLQAIKPEI